MGGCEGTRLHLKRTRKQFERIAPQLPRHYVSERGHTFILERQTAESKVGPKKIYKKVEDHKRYVELKLRAPAEVLFAFDAHGSHLVDTAIRAGEQHDIRVVAGDVAQIADYLYNSAARLY